MTAVFAAASLLAAPRRGALGRVLLPLVATPAVGLGLLMMAGRPGTGLFLSAADRLGLTFGG